MKSSKLILRNFLERGLSQDMSSRSTGPAGARSLAGNFMIAWQDPTGQNIYAIH